MSRQAFDLALERLLAALAQVDPSSPTAADALARDLPADSTELQGLKALVRRGVAEGWLADRENDGIRYSRVRKAASETALSVDVVNMSKPGPGHTHPNGEIDLAFAVSGEPRFDGRPEGWTVYPPGSWHVPTVTGGEMDILYFLPGGAIRFGPKPE